MLPQWKALMAQHLDELLGLNKKGLKSVTLLPLGHRDEAGDWLVNLKKVRSPKEEFLIEFIIGKHIII